MARTCEFKQSYIESENSPKDHTSKCAYCIGNFPDYAYTKCQTFLETERNKEKGADLETT